MDQLFRKTHTMPGAHAEARERAERALGSTIGISGPAVLFEPDALKDRLIDGGAAPYETELLLAALEAQIPQDLLAAHGEDALRAIESGKTRLAGERPFARVDAAWAVDAWGRCLGLAAGIGVESPVATSALPDAMTSGPCRTHAETLDDAGSVAPSAHERAPAFVLPATPARTTAMTWAGSTLSIVLLAGVVFAADHFAGYAHRDAPLTAEPVARRADAEAPPTRADVAPSAEMPASAAPPRVEATNTPVIADAMTDAPLVADGRSHDVIVALDAPRADVTAIATRFVSGDAALWAAPRTIPVATGGDSRARFAAGSVQIRSKRPAKAVFEYVVIAQDGTRSAPFRKELSVLPSPPAGVGEARTVDEVRSASVSPSSRAPRGQDASAPQCARTTCGRVLAVRMTPDSPAFIRKVATALHLGEPARPPSFDVYVRTDDAVVHTFRTTTAWKNGSRVRIVQGRLVAIARPRASSEASTALPARPQTVAAADPQAGL